MLVKNSKKKKIINLIVALLMVFIIGFTLTLILNKDIRTAVGKRLQEIFKASEIETKIDYEIEPLSRRKLKCTTNSRKSKRNR